MLKQAIRNPLFLFYLLVLYVVTQFSWWLYLIASLYGKIYTDPQILEKKTMMLVGEGTVFVIILFGGAFMIRRAYQKEHDLNKLQENFLLSVSHELKTPISSVTLFLQTLKRHDLDETKRQDIYDQSLTEIDRLENLVSNLLLTRSIENKNYFLNKSPLELDKILHELVERLQGAALKKHHVSVTAESLQLDADREAIVSIFTNILQNAAKYSPTGSQIDVTLSRKKDGIVFEVSDQGIGIPDAKKNKVFNRFYRDENEMTRKSKGTGLGLFITRFLVELHNGKIELEDNTPQGLRVKVTFKTS